MSRATQISPTLPKQPKRPYCALMVSLHPDALPILLPHCTGGKTRGAGQFLSRLLFEFQAREEAKAQERARLGQESEVPRKA
jgi:hypothetical protein